MRTDRVELPKRLFCLLLYNVNFLFFRALGSKQIYERGYYVVTTLLYVYFNSLEYLL